MKTAPYIIFFFFSCFTFAQEWHSDFDEAKQLAKTKQQNIVLVFQGSDWCAPCIKLDKEIWSTENYKTLAKDHFIMLKADFPRKKTNQLPEEQKAQNAKLFEKYNAEGYFPLVVVLTPDGKVLGKMGYKKLSPEDYFKKLTAFEN